MSNTANAEPKDTRLILDWAIDLLKIIYAQYPSKNTEVDRLLEVYEERYGKKSGRSTD